MPSITFTMKNVNNTPVTFTEFVITAGFPDGGFDPEMELPAPSSHTTDQYGRFTVTLPATGGPYYLSKAGNRVASTSAYKFFVPDVPGPLEGEYLYVDLGVHQRLVNDVSLLALIDAKTSVSAAVALVESAAESSEAAKVAAEAAQAAAEEAQTNLEAAESAAASSATTALAAQAAAEVASDAALAAGAVYADTAAGLAATVDGEYFYVLSPSNTAVFDLYKNVTEVAEFKKTVPTAQAIQGIERALGAASKQVNQFDHAEVRAASKDRFAVVYGALTMETYSNETVFKLVSNGSGLGRVYRRFLKSDFGSATTISAAVDVVAMDAGTTATFNIIQRGSGSNVLSTTTVNIGASAVTTPTTFRNDGVILDGSCYYIDFDLVCYKTSGDLTRTAYYRNLVICAGASSYYRDPAQFVVMNYFPDPDFFGFNATTFDGVRGVESNEVILNLSSNGVSVRQAIYQMAATGIFAPGNFLTLSAECYCNATGTNTSTDLTIIFYDASAAEISRTTQVSASSANTWHELRTFGTVPANTAYFVLRFVARAAGTTTKYRRVVVTNPAEAGYRQVVAAVPGNGRNVQARNLVYVATTGSDATGDGGINTPFLTITRGVKAAKPDGIVVIRAGTYNEAINLAGCLNVDFMAYPNERVRINRGTLLASFTKTGGIPRSTNVPIRTIRPLPGYGSMMYRMRTRPSVLQSACPFNAGKPIACRLPGCTRRLPLLKWMRLLAVHTTGMGLRPSTSVPRMAAIPLPMGKAITCLPRILVSTGVLVSRLSGLRISSSGTVSKALTEATRDTWS